MLKNKFLHPFRNQSLLIVLISNKVKINWPKKSSKFTLNVHKSKPDSTHKAALKELLLLTGSTASQNKPSSFTPAQPQGIPAALEAHNPESSHPTSRHSPSHCTHPPKALTQLCLHTQSTHSPQATAAFLQLPTSPSHRLSFLKFTACKLGGI